jgi:DNA-binding MarR family transcriptional regulator
MKRTPKNAAALWIRLAKCYGLVLRDVRRRVANGMTLPQFDALAQLHRHPDGMTASELSRELLVTAGNVTGIVARLEARGHVRRECNPRDRRVAVLRLTGAGRRLARREIERHERLLATIFEGLAPEEERRLCDALDHLRAALDPSDEKEGAE